MEKMIIIKMNYKFDNIDIFNTNPTIKKNKLIKLLNYQKFDEIKDKKMIEYLNNILIPYIDNLKSQDISIKDFVSFMIKDKKKYNAYY